MLNRRNFNRIITSIRDDAAAIIEALSTMPGIHSSLGEWQAWQNEKDISLRKRLTKRIFGGNYNHIGRNN